MDAPNVWPPFVYSLIQGLLQHTTAKATSNQTNTANQRLYNMGVELAQRYLDSAFCTWRSTGGAIPNVLPDLPNSPPNATGTIFEKYADNSTNEAGGGGEYVVVPGFGVESIGERTNSSGVMAFFFGLAICLVTN